MNPRNFFAELKRRNVYRVAVAYLVVSWLIIQVATQVFPFFEIPNRAVRLVALLLVLGFPVALVSAWAFAITPESVIRVEKVPPNESIAVLPFASDSGEKDEQYFSDGLQRDPRFAAFCEEVGLPARTDAKAMP